jgi:hypothetical protein
MPKVLVVEFCALRCKVYHQLWFLFSCSSSSFCFKKIKSEKNETHWTHHHTVCDVVSGVTKEGCHPCELVCLVSGTGSVVREVQGVFSVFFVVVPPAGCAPVRPPYAVPPWGAHRTQRAGRLRIGPVVLLL